MQSIPRKSFHVIIRFVELTYRSNADIFYFYLMAIYRLKIQASRELNFNEVRIIRRLRFSFVDFFFFYLSVYLDLLLRCFHHQRLLALLLRDRLRLNLILVR